MVDTKKCLPSFLCYTKEKELNYMGIPKGGRNVSHSKEEKPALVLRNLAEKATVSIDYFRVITLHCFIFQPCICLKHFASVLGCMLVAVFYIVVDLF